MTFRSSVDVWVALAITAGIAGVGIALAGASATAVGVPWLSIATLLVAGVCLPLWILIGTRYVVADNLLTIVSGPLRWRIPVASIKSVTPTRSLWASPALSLDRLRIVYGRNRSVLVSPDDKAAFVSALGLAA